MRNKLSVIIICKDEESRIRRCLESVKWVNEIVVIDSGSTDKTLEIVREYTDEIHINTDWAGFGPQKKLAETKANNDWILSLDADEVVSDDLREEIINLMESVDEKTVYRLNRLTSFCYKFIKHSGWHPDRVVRLYNKKHYHFNDAYVHEVVETMGAKKVDLKAKLFHYTFETLEDYMDKRNGYAKSWAESQFLKGRTVSSFSIVAHTLFAFFRHYIIRLGFLDGYEGFLISMIQMQYTFNKYNYLKYKNIAKSK